MTVKKIIPTICPSCGGQLTVQALHCHQCDTTISSEFNIPPIMLLRPDEQVFISNFIKCSGSLKQMAKDMGLSYPTVRNILDEIITNLQKLENDGTTI